MAAQKVLVVVSAFLVQAVFGQTYVTGNNVIENVILDNAGPSYAYNGLTGLANTGYGLANAGLVGSNVGVIGAGLSNSIGGNLVGYPNFLNIGSSGPLSVSTISPIGPSGLAVASENVIEGTLFVTGSLPFLSAVAFEGAFPTVGSGVATCGCGNGAVGILSEGFPTTGPYF